MNRNKSKTTIKLLVNRLRDIIIDINRGGDRLISTNDHRQLESLVREYYPKLSEVQVDRIVNRLYSSEIDSAMLTQLSTLIIQSIPDWSWIDRYNEHDLRDYFGRGLKNSLPDDQYVSQLTEQMVEKYRLPDGLESEQILSLDYEIEGLNIIEAFRQIEDTIIMTPQFNYLERDPSTLRDYTVMVMEAIYQTSKQDALDLIYDYLESAIDWESLSDQSYQLVYDYIDSQLKRVGIHLSRIELDKLITSLLEDIPSHIIEATDLIGFHLLHYSLSIGMSQPVN